MSLDNKKCLCWIHNHIPSDVTSKSRNSDSLSRYLRWILCEIVLYIVLLLLFLLLIWKQVMIVIGTYIKSNKLWKRKLIQDIGRCMLSIGNFSFLFSAKTLSVSQLSKVKCRWSGPYSALSYILCRLSWQMIDIDVKTFIKNSFIKTFTATMLSI